MIPKIKIKCDHNGGLEYWCRDCAFEAADLLRRENEQLASEVRWLRERLPKPPRGRK